MTEQSPDEVAPMSDPIGWYVRVKTDEIYDGVYDTVLYVVGLPTPTEAEAAVKDSRLKSGERYEVLPEPVTPGKGPQPATGQVWLLTGAT